MCQTYNFQAAKHNMNPATLSCVHHLIRNLERGESPPMSCQFRQTKKNHVLPPTATVLPNYDVILCPPKLSVCKCVLLFGHNFDQLKCRLCLPVCLLCTLHAFLPPLSRNTPCNRQADVQIPSCASSA